MLAGIGNPMAPPVETAAVGAAFETALPLGHGLGVMAGVDPETYDSVLMGVIDKRSRAAAAKYRMGGFSSTQSFDAQVFA